MEKGEWKASTVINEGQLSLADHRSLNTAHCPPTTAQPITIHDLLFAWDSRFWILDLGFGGTVGQMTHVFR
jgi:hypothetical protein